MKFIKRLGFYLLGFAIGLVFLAYFLKGKNAEFCYSPNCRVLKNISGKPIAMAPETTQFFTENGLDSAKIRILLKEGDVIFSESEPHKAPCACYIIKGSINDKPVKISVENCDTIARIKKIAPVN